MNGTPSCSGIDRCWQNGVMNLAEDLIAHLGQFQTAPFLFVGSGFSRRYAESEDWQGLLRRFADEVGTPYERYASKFGGSFTHIASAIAADFHDIWWEDDAYEDSRSEYPAPRGIASPLKIEVAKSLGDLVAKLPVDGPLNGELEALREATIEGVITTNYDSLLEHLFPEFKVFAGQDELLFHDPVGVGEIYKIHGSISDPETVVLTAEDYAAFADRDVYLAAKLLTIFVEHPVIFLGYSLEDDNVREILTSIAKVLTKENIGKLQNRLIFVQWHADPVQPALVPTPFPIDGLSLPVVAVHVNDFAEIFSALGGIRRRFPTKFLHELKQEVYELVRTSKPKGRLYVQDIDSDTDSADIDVVIGVGIQGKLASQGVVGLQRRELLQDILTSTLPEDPAVMQEIVNRVLPRYLSGATNTPIYRYLRHAGELKKDGSPADSTRLPANVAKRHAAVSSALRAPSGYIKRALEQVSACGSLEQLLADYSLSEALFSIPHLDVDKIDIKLLRDFLTANSSLLDSGKGLEPTQWAKCVCFLDYIENGPGGAQLP